MVAACRICVWLQTNRRGGTVKPSAPRRFSANEITAFSVLPYWTFDSFHLLIDMES
jgi:hypothetical protein